MKFQTETLPLPELVVAHTWISKKLENMQAMIRLHFAHYNFVRLRRTLWVTPAMAAEVIDPALVA
jgi:hypothetical protein